MTNRRLLLICYYFPPTPSVGSVRVCGLAKYLPRFGWDVTVLTPERPGRPLPGLRIVETADADLAARWKRRLGLPVEAALKDIAAGGSAGPPVRGLRARTIDAVKAAVAFPDNHRGWARIALEAAERLLAAESFDALLSSSPPVSAHLAARWVRNRHPLPWVVDLRDLWSTDRNSSAPRWRRVLDRSIERRTLAAAASLVTVSEPLAAELRRIYPGAAVSAIVNGFDPDEVVRGARGDSLFTITHTGTFYQGRRDPELFFTVVSRLLADGRIPRDRIRIRFFARHEPWVVALARRLGVADVVSVLPWASRDEALRAQRESQVLLLLHWGGAAEVGVYTGKVFEYLAARRPILLVGGPRGVLTDLLKDTGAGVHVTRAEEIAGWLQHAFQEFRTSGAVSYHGNEREIEKYSQIRMAEEFVRVLNRAVDGAVEPLPAGTPVRN